MTGSKFKEGMGRISNEKLHLGEPGLKDKKIDLPLDGVTGTSKWYLGFLKTFYIALKHKLRSCMSF